MLAIVSAGFLADHLVSFLPGRQALSESMALRCCLAAAGSPLAVGAPPCSEFEGWDLQQEAWTLQGHALACQQPGLA